MQNLQISAACFGQSPDKAEFVAQHVPDAPLPLPNWPMCACIWFNFFGRGFYDWSPPLPWRSHFVGCCSLLCYTVHSAGVHNTLIDRVHIATRWDAYFPTYVFFLVSCFGHSPVWHHKGTVVSVSLSPDKAPFVARHVRDAPLSPHNRTL